MSDVGEINQSNVDETETINDNAIDTTDSAAAALADGIKIKVTVSPDASGNLQATIDNEQTVAIAKLSEQISKRKESTGGSSRKSKKGGKSKKSKGRKSKKTRKSLRRK